MATENATTETEEPTTKGRHQTSVPVDGETDPAKTADGPEKTRHQTTQPAD